MSKKAMVITVGGSFYPVVISIKKHNPDFIYFICSAGKDQKSSSSQCVDGEGEPCKNDSKSYPNIIIQANYKKGYKKIEIEDPDDFEEIYKKTKEAIKEAKEKYYEIISDFTAGTKAMTAALATISTLDFDIKPYLVKGRRNDLIKTTEGSVPVNLEQQFNNYRVEILLKIYENFTLKLLYNSSISILDKILDMGLKGEMDKFIRQKREKCYSFYLWDIFQYEEAFNLLKEYASEFKYEFDFLLKILEKKKSNGYEKFFDLLSNAKRQAQLGFYDNAVSRLYRALELLEQIRLKKEYDIDTNALENSLDKLKNKEKWEKKKNEEGKIKIGLQNGFELLDELGDSFGKIYKEHKNEFLDNLKIRNLSKLAHGDEPIKENEWKKFYNFFEKFTKKCFDEIRLIIEEINFPNKI